MAIALTVEELIHIYLKETLTELKNDIYCLFFFGEVVVCLNLCLALSSSLAGLSVSFFPLPSLSPCSFISLSEERFLFRRVFVDSDSDIIPLTRQDHRTCLCSPPICLTCMSAIYVLPLPPSVSQRTICLLESPSV